MFKIDMEKFTDAMATKELNPVDLAREAGVAPATVTRTLQTNAIYSYKVLGKIAKALDITPSKLILDCIVERPTKKSKKKVAEPPQV